MAEPERPAQVHLERAGQLAGRVAFGHIQNQELGETNPVGKGVQGQVELPDLTVSRQDREILGSGLQPADPFSQSHRLPGKLPPGQPGQCYRPGQEHQAADIAAG